MEQYLYSHGVVEEGNSARAKRGRYSATLHHIIEPLKKNFMKNLKLELAAAGRVWGIVQASVFGVFLFLFGFEEVVALVAFVLPFVIIYVAGKYLTLLPMYVVAVLQFIPKKVSLPIVGLSALLSLFIVFLI